VRVSISFFFAGLEKEGLPIVFGWDGQRGEPTEAGKGEVEKRNRKPICQKKKKTSLNTKLWGILGGTIHQEFFSMALIIAFRIVFCFS